MYAATAKTTSLSSSPITTLKKYQSTIKYNPTEKRRTDADTKKRGKEQNKKKDLKTTKKNQKRTIATIKTKKTKHSKKKKSEPSFAVWSPKSMTKSGLSHKSLSFSTSSKNMDRIGKKFTNL